MERGSGREGWHERRRATRYRVNLRARWEGSRAARDATVTDLSEYGCFVLTDDLVEKRETVRLEIQLPRAGRITLWGTVVYQAEEIGFALNFERFADEADRRKLEWLLRIAAHRSEKQ
ncbi:MAG: PilZ domain-containing protein [Acidobacteria bacterium]|nr:PilZ domain-containing protein [Acidobacteriota bacterium]MCA1619793.1 PilZ domain-containing protein [Acidobacteriota bacterium]